MGDTLSAIAGKGSTGKERLWICIHYDFNIFIIIIIVIIIISIVIITNVYSDITGYYFLFVFLP